LNARLLRVEVIELKNEVFYGNLVVETDNGHLVNVDSRPSDALALAVRSNVPILVSKKVMDEAGIIPEKDIAESGEDSSKTEPADAESQVADDRLTAFEEFLDSMDISDDTTGEEDNDKDES
jgi:bifunctional DNase/RNase